MLIKLFWVLILGLMVMPILLSYGVQRKKYLKSWRMKHRIGKSEDMF